LASSAPGTYTVTYSFGTAPCNGTATSTVTVNAQPTATVSGGTFCATGTTTLITTGATGGTFSASPAGLSINANTGVINLAASLPNTYTVTYSFGTAPCNGNATSTVTVNAQPTATVSGGTFCATGTTTLTTTGATGGTFSSSPAGLGINTSTGIINLSASTPGNYTINYAFSLGNCNGTATSQVTVNAHPTATVSGGTFCATGTTTLTTTGATGGTFTASPAGLAINANTGVIDLAASASNTYIITYNFGTGLCSGSATSQVIVTALPNIVITDPPSSCTSVDITASAVTAGSDAGLTFTYWKDAAATVTLANANAVSVSGTYYIKGTTSGSCFTIKPVLVIIDPFVTPAVTIAASATAVCLGTAVTFTATPVNGGNNPSYQWKINGTSIAGATASVFTTTSLANGDKVTVVMMSNAKCTTAPSAESNEIVMTITSVTPAVNIAASATTVCSGIAITFTAKPTNGGNNPAYQWKVNGTDVAGATASIFTTAVLSNGDKVTVELTSNANCTTTPTAISNEISVVINPIPVIKITDPAGVCSPSVVDITASAVTAGSDAGLTFTYFTDAAATNPLSNPNAAAVSGTYYIKGTSAAGCYDIKPVKVTINPLPNLVINNPAAVCAPGTVDITATAITAGSDASLTFSYFTDVAATATLNNPNAVAVGGTYYIKATTVFGCVTIKPVTVIINALPTAAISGGGNLCLGLSRTLDIAFTGTGPWSVTYSDGNTNFTINSIATSTYKLVVSPVSNTTYSLISVADANCSNTASGSTTVVVSQPVAAVRYKTISATANIPKQLSARIFTPTDQYAWNPAVGLNNYSVSNPVFNYNRTTDYTITIALSTGCTVVDSLLVEVYPASAPAVTTSEVFIPKAFSPNGDGYNDKLTPLLLRIKDFKYFRVFNRWGQLIYETTIRGEGWDGTFKNVPQGADVYTWTIEATGDDGRTYSRRGTSVLLR
ncbi:MAG: gliding motility-associated C-terminal domain-containing protein, partial [Bacteroidota bacterium]|nr:gliding motility-associated C-terminal domain-containing protein [Bacteroidota bacterium]